MTLEEVRQEMDRYWEQVHQQADEMKDPYVALDRLHALYRRLDATEQALGDQVLTEWVLSPIEAKRFDAIALIREFRITSAEPALRDLTERLERSDDPGAPFESEKVSGLLAELAIRWDQSSQD